MIRTVIDCVAFIFEIKKFSMYRSYTATDKTAVSLRSPHILHSKPVRNGKECGRRGKKRVKKGGEGRAEIEGK